jgi:tol-pal system protein YbgF
MRRILSAALIVTMAATAAGCFYPYERAKLLEAKVARLDSEQQALQSQIVEARERVDATVAKVTAALEQLDSASRRTDADIGVQLGKLVEDVGALTGQLDQERFQLTQLEARLAQLGQDVETRLAPLESPDAQKAAATRRRTEELKQQSAKASPQELLALAAERSGANQEAEARMLYADFLARFPRDPLLPRALYGLGQSYQREQKCREALYEYQKVVQGHGKSAQAPEALLSSSECFAQLKMTQESRLALETVVQDYPRSPSATEAKARLAKLDAAAKPKAAPRKATPKRKAPAPKK